MKMGVRRPGGRGDAMIMAWTGRSTREMVRPA